MFSIPNSSASLSIEVSKIYLINRNYLKISYTEMNMISYITDDYTSQIIYTCQVGDSGQLLAFESKMVLSFVLQGLIATLMLDFLFG